MHRGASAGRVMRTRTLSIGRMMFLPYLLSKSDNFLRIGPY
jgi:hypothetical protein